MYVDVYTCMYSIKPTTGTLTSIIFPFIRLPPAFQVQLITTNVSYSLIVDFWFLAYTWQCSGPTTDSSLRDYSWHL